jgi:Cupin-like domain
MASQYRILEKVDSLSPADFNKYFLGREPVLFTEETGSWKGLTTWTHDYLKNVHCSKPVKIRPPRDSHVAMMEAHEEGVGNGSISRLAFPPYLHDTPLIKYAPELVRDFPNFPAQYLPRWYRQNWAELALFFIGPAKGLTPLHFDSCGTHNMFFQMTGTKRFIIVPAEEHACCYRMNWHWSPIDAENPDYRRFPLYSEANPVECVIGPGEILYMPPCTWHQVRIIEPSISFNIDWHTASSAWRGVAAMFNGMPARNAILYNMPQAVGLTTGMKAAWMGRMMQAHLDYVD